MVAMLGSLGWPLLLGLSACAIFYALILQGPLGSESIRRYFATHPVSYAATGMFFVGLAALLLKLINLVGQFAALSSLTFGMERGVPLEHCSDMLDQLEELPSTARRSYLGRRLRDALEYVERRATAEGLDEELKYLSDVDADRQHDSYALVRIIIWATPMLGFLGTVIGITQALGDLDPKMLATAIQTAMEGLLAGLYVAFDTTALALSLSILLMFFQFFVDRIESQLLSIVDTRVSEELIGCFESVGTANDPHLQSIQRMAQEVIQTSEELIRRQSEIWEQSIDSSQRRWLEATKNSADEIHTLLREGMDASLTSFANRIAENQQDAADQASRRWEQWQTNLSQNARMLHAQQQELVKQGEVMARVVEATGEVVKLETTLNQNLKLLAGAKNFEDTVMSLAAAIHLLNTRLGASDADRRQVELGGNSSQGRAA
jgi:biopolymer transport protein ExbB/TolQ